MYTRFFHLEIGGRQFRAKVNIFPGEKGCTYGEYDRAVEPVADEFEVESVHLEIVNLREFEYYFKKEIEAAIAQDALDNVVNSL